MRSNKSNIERCETHVHHKYITFSSSSVYHLNKDAQMGIPISLSHTGCGISVIHPYKWHNPDNGCEVLVCQFEGGTPFASFHESVPKHKQLCSHCKKQQQIGKYHEM